MKNIFVSSTFRDMQAERDMIQTEVLPQLRSKAKAYGESINMIDLRWGVDTSELESAEGSMKVMSVCLDEVERSKPHMLVFLGDRYGSIIDPLITEKVIARKNSTFTLEDYAISITAMEVEFGVLSGNYGSTENSVVCIRSFSPEVIKDEADRMSYSAENEELAKKQQAFKEKVAKKVQGHVIEYTCDWDEEKKCLVNFRTLSGKKLSEALIDIYEEMFRADWNTYHQMTWEEKEQLAVQGLIERKLRTFQGREDLLENYYSKIKGEMNILILQGEAGCGKTGIMCKLADRLRQEGKNVFFFSAANSAYSATYLQLEQQRLYYLEKLYGKSQPEKELLTEENDAGARKKESVLGGIERRIEDLLKSIKEEERPYFFIDGLECMKPDILVNKLGFILPNAKAKYIVSCNETFEIERCSHSRTEIWEEIPDLTDSDAKNVMEGMLNALSKNLYKEIEEEVLLKNCKKNPFYINMIVQRLNMMGFEDLQQARTEQDIVKHSIEVIREIPDDMEGAALHLLKNAIDSLGGAKQRFYDVVYLIGVSRSGLRESDILTISKKLGNEITQVDLSRFIHYVDFLFAVREDGQIVFSNEFIQDGILKKIERQKYVNAIADYVKSLDMDDNLKRSEGMYYARITQDAKAAEEIFVYLCEHFDRTLGMSVVEEAYADKGVFYCAKMEEMPQAFRFFANIWYNLSFLEIRSKEELEIHGKVCSQFVSCMERQLEKEEKSVYLWYLYKAYRNEEKICEMTSEDEVACMEKALNVISKLWEKEQSIQSECEVANCYNAMAWAYKRNGQLEKACRIRAKEIKLWQTIYYKKTREWKHLGSIAHASYELYWLYREAQNEGMAKLYFWFAVNYYEDMYRIKYDTNFLQKISDIYSEAGELLIEEGKVEDAYSYYEKAIQMAQQSCEYEAEEKNKSSSWKKLCLRYQDMGGLLRNQNRTEEALEYFKKSLVAIQKACEIFPIKSYKKDMHITYYNIGIILCELDRKEMAKDYFVTAKNLLLEACRDYIDKESRETLERINQMLTSLEGV